MGSQYDFKRLVKAYPPLGKYLIQQDDHFTIPFDEEEAVKALNKAILIKDYKVEFYQLPDGFLYPHVPGRAAYLDLLHELIGQEHKITVWDVGVGANCIYPIIAASKYKWQIIGTEVDQVSLKIAKAIIQYNPRISKKISLRKQDPSHIFFGVLKSHEHVHATLCNPPFYSSEEAYVNAQKRKLKNLNLTQRDQVGRSNELWTKGGELAFIKQMILESVDISDQVGIFTSLVSNQRHLLLLQKEAEFRGFHHDTHELSIGKKKMNVFTWWKED